MKYLLLLLCASLTFGQEKFMESQIVFKNGETKSGYILYKDWHNAPEEITFKSSLENQEELISLKSEVSAFEILNTVKYIYATIQFDKSSSKVSELSFVRNPEYIEKSGFLKVMVEGKASLYSFTSGGVTKFFVSTEKLKFEPLIHKKYLAEQSDSNTYNSTTSTKIATNYTYIPLLNEHVSCGEQAPNYNNLSYDENALKKYFIKYNTCEGATTTYEMPTKKAIFKLGILGGYSMINSSFEILTVSDNKVNDSKNLQSFRFGIQSEIKFPIHNYRSSLIAELSYISFSNDYNTITANNTTAIDLEYKFNFIDFNIGVRYQFLPPIQKHNFFGEALITPLSFNVGENYVKYDTTYNLGLSTEQTISNDIDLAHKIKMQLGLGYNFNNKLTASVRYVLPNESLKTTASSVKTSEINFLLSYYFM